MTTIDSRVVEARFEGSQFAAGVSGAMGILEKLKASLKMDGAAKGLDEVSKTAGKVPHSLSGIASAASGAAKGFSALSVVGVAALATIASKATQTGLAMAKSFTVAPLMDGFKEYETKLGSIQTIMANTQAAGTSLKDVSGTLNELNTYSDQTIYNFGEMAKNIGTFTAAGVDLKTATSSIKGIANLAALSGSNSQQASTAMYQLSQAISAGKVSLMDWNSVVNAGMGGSVFQRALAETAVAMDKLPASALKLEGPMKNVKISGESFRQSISSENGPSWLTSDVLTTALGSFTGDLTDAELAATGFTQSQIKAIQATAKTAKEAATVVKTGTQLMGTLKEAAGSGWAQTWELIIGDFNEAKTLWTGASNAFGGIIQNSAKARNKVLGDWKAMGGRTALIDGIKNAWDALLRVMKPIREAFREIFPAKTGADLYKMTQTFAAFTEKLKIGADTAANLKRTFAGVFAIFSIVGQVLSAAGSQVARFFGAVGNGSGGFLNFTGGIGDFLVSLDKMMKKTGVVKGFFQGIGNVLAVPLRLIKSFASAISNMFSGFGAGKGKAVADSFGNLSTRLDSLRSVGEKLRGVFSAIGSMFDRLGPKIGSALAAIGTKLGETFNSASFSHILDLVNTGLLTGLFVLIKKFLSGGMKVDVGGGLLSSITDTFGALTDKLKVMQSSVKADTLLKIAGALAVLTASIVVLSTIDDKKLSTALGGLAVGLAGLGAVLVVLSKSVTVLGTLKLPLLAGSLVAVAAGLLLMAVALKIIASINSDDIGRSLLAMGISLGIVAGAMRLMPKNMTAQAVSIGILGASLIVLATSLKLFATMSWAEMAKGMVGLAGSLVLIGAAMRVMPKDMVLQAAALTILSVALTGIAAAMFLFQTMSLAAIGTGLLGIGGSLVVIAGAMTLMPQNMLLQSVALNAVAVALTILGGALLIMGGMSVGEIAKSLVTLAGSLVILAAGLAMMSGSLSGAAALVVAAGALAVLTPVLITLGNLSWQTIVTGLLAIAGVFTVLGVAGLVLAPLTPVIIGLAAAMVLIGAGMALAGAGALAFATAFGIVVAAGAAGVAILGKVLATLIASIPPALAALGRGIGAMAGEIAKHGPEFVAAMSTILQSILKAINTNAPRIVDTFSRMLNLLLSTIVSAAPRIAAAGLLLITRMLSVMAANVGKIVTVATTLIVNFINAISANLGRVIQAGVTLVISFINGVANAIRNNSAAMGAAGANLGMAIVEGMARGIAGGIGVVVSAAKNLASSALSAAKGVLGIHSPSKEFEAIGKYSVAGFVKGLNGNRQEVRDSWTAMLDLMRAGVKAFDEDIATASANIKKLQTAEDAGVKTAQARLDKLNAAKKKDKAAIAAAQAAVAAARKKNDAAIAKETAASKQAAAEKAKTMAAYNSMNKVLINQRYELEKLADDYDTVTEKLKDANKSLEDAIKTRDDYQNSLATQYSALPGIEKDTKLTDYIRDLEDKLIDTKAFTEAIQKLRDLGLNDEIYKELLSKGTDALPFVQQIAAGGQKSVDLVNRLSDGLTKAAQTLGSKAATNLYQAGVDAAQGLVNGLSSQQAAIDSKMATIANAMLATLKKTLGIKSPSKEFAKLGKWSTEGLAQGLKTTTNVTNAAEKVGAEALNALRTSMTGLSDIVIGSMDMNPVITPVLDLSGVQKDAKSLGGMLPNGSLSVDGAYSKATMASKGYDSNLYATTTTGTPAATPAALTFTQINNSPKALSSADIYRRTNNQLSRVKGVLSI